MRLLDSILISLSIGFFMIGVHQLITVGLIQSYWVFMISTILLGWYQVRKRNRKGEEPQERSQNNAKGKKQSKKTKNRVS